MSENSACLGSWGYQTLDLSLPVATVRISGLSEFQAQSISEQYAYFIAPDTPHPVNRAVSLAAGQLARGPGLPAAAFSVNGQYALRKNHHKDGIELTGFNFRAAIQFGGSEGSWLRVEREPELPQTGVLENFLRVYSAYKALELGGAILHSAGLVFGDRAYIFVGRSNAGKTTLTRKAHEAGARVLSDDMNLLLPSPGGYRAHAVPFAGEFGRTLDQDLRHSYKVAGIVLLEQGTKLESQPVITPRAVTGLLVGSPFVNDDEDEVPALLEVLYRMAETVPVCRLRCQREDSPESILNEIQKVIP